MKIACIGWGSLIWNPGSLLLKSEWYPDGPNLPIEFARQSQDGRLTLVIVEKHKLVNTLWGYMNTDDMETAKRSLQERENILLKNLDKHIGMIGIDDPPANPIESTIKSWLISKKIDAAIWTALGPKFNKIEKAPTEQEAIKYLKGLTGEKKSIAEEYVKNTSPQINTRFREIIKKELNW